MQIIVGTLRKRRFGCHVSNYSAQCFLHNNTPTYAEAKELLDSILNELLNFFNTMSSDVSSAEPTTKILTEEEARSANIPVTDPEPWTLSEINLPRATFTESAQKPESNTGSASSFSTQTSSWGKGKKLAIIASAAFAALVIGLVAASSSALSQEEVATLRNFDRSNYELMDYCWVEYTEGKVAGSRGIRSDDYNRCAEAMAHSYDVCESQSNEALKYVPSCTDSRLQSAATFWNREQDLAKIREASENERSSDTGSPPPTQSSGTTFEQSSYIEPATQLPFSFGNFEISKSSISDYQFALTIMQGNKLTAANGIAHISIRDGKNVLLFNKDITVNSADFKTYSWLNDAPTLAWVHSVPANEIKDGSGNGFVEITFTPSTGEPASITYEDVQIPQNENIAKITHLLINPTNGNYNYLVQFGLENTHSQEVSTNGETRLKIVDKYENVLYDKKLATKESDFHTLTALDGTKFFGWSIEIPMSEIKGGLQSGTATLSFSPKTGNVLHGSVSPIFIPPLSYSEAEAKYREYYLDSSTVFNISTEVKKIEITLVRAGVFTHLKDGDAFGVTKEFRADILVTNKDDTPKMAPVFLDSYIVDKENKQYRATAFSYELGTHTSGGQVFPNVILSGFIRFEEVPRPDEPITVVIKGIGGYYNERSDVLWEFPIILDLK